MAHTKQTSNYFLLSYLFLIFAAEIFLFATQTQYKIFCSFTQILGSLSVYLEIIQLHNGNCSGTQWKFIYLFIGKLRMVCQHPVQNRSMISACGGLDVQRQAECDVDRDSQDDQGYGILLKKIPCIKSRFELFGQCLKLMNVTK